VPATLHRNPVLDGAYPERALMGWHYSPLHATMAATTQRRLRVVGVDRGT
jgi:hypothetical protein